MADVNTTNLREPDPLNWETYADSGGERKPLAPKGVYTLAVDSVEKGATKEGYLQYVVTSHIVDGPQAGVEIRYTRWNTKKWPKKDGNGLADYLRGFGMPGPFRSNAEYEQAVERTIGRTYKGGVDWEGYHTGTGTRIEGEEKFPLVSGNGGEPTRQEWVNHPDGLQDIDPETGQVRLTKDGTPRLVRIYANNRIKYVLSAVKR